MTIGSNKPKNAAKPVFPPHLFSVLVCLYLATQTANLIDADIDFD